MPHKTTWETEGIYWQLSGIISIDETHRLVHEMLGSSNFDALKYYICDASNIEKVNFSEKEQDVPAAIAKSSNFYKPTLKGAFVSDREDILKFMETYINISNELGSSWEHKIFNRIEDARKWVSL